MAVVRRSNSSRLDIGGNKSAFGRIGRVAEVREVTELFCPYNCKFLKPTEEEQTSRKEEHICQKYNKRVMHLGNHPQLVRLAECQNEPSMK